MTTIDGFCITDVHSMADMMIHEANISKLYLTMFNTSTPPFAEKITLYDNMMAAISHLASFGYSNSIETLWEGWDTYCKMRTHWDSLAVLYLGRHLGKVYDEHLWHRLTVIIKEILARQTAFQKQHQLIVDLQMSRTLQFS